MIKILMFSTKPEELPMVRGFIAQYSLVHSWAESELQATRELKVWSQWTQEDDVVDVLICDVAAQGALAALTAAKERHSQALVVPIAGPSVPPTAYVRPEIMPSGLLWRPLTEAGAGQTMTALFSSLHADRVPASEQRFEIKTRQRTQYVPYGEIYYFEAREKRVFLRTAYSEISLHCTLRQLEEQLPEEFVRCHKSYLVNREHILSVSRTEQYVEMDSQIVVPLSRRYKNCLQEVAI